MLSTLLLIGLLTSCVSIVAAIGASKETLCDRAAIFTPHDLTDSENTRYLMSVISSLQMLWCNKIDVLVTENNACKSDTCLESSPMAGTYVKVQSKFPYKPHVRMVAAISGDSNLRPVDNNEGLLTDEYNVFVLIGDTKLPSYRGIGKDINFYVCNFPVDKDMIDTEEKVSYLVSYDGVIASSSYARMWYSEYIQPYFLRGHSLNFPLPDLLSVYPPVIPLKLPQEAPHFSALNTSIYISFYGDFLPSAIDNGHENALVLLSRLKKDFVYAHLKLYIMGRRSNSEGTDDYIAKLKNVATTGQLDVSFIIDPDISILSENIGKSLLFW